MERCARSLLDQTLDDIEFIFVDDRSPDSAYEIMLRIVEEGRYSHLKDKIKIVRHERNRGVPAVRRTGVETSSGDYIYFCDSDDWLDREMLRKLWEKAVEGDYDLVECSYYETDGKEYCKERGCPTGINLWKEWIKWPCCTSLLNKVFKRSLFEKGIIWPEQPYLEDFSVSLQLYYYAKKACYIDEPLYYYYQNPSSIMHSAGPERKVPGLIEQERIMEAFMRREGQYDKYRTFLMKLKADAIAEAWNLPRKEFLKVFPEDRLKVMFSSKVPLKVRLGILTKVLGIHGISGKKRS